MKRTEISELDYITHVENVASICERGILSHHRAEKVAHVDVSLAEVQDRRSNKRVPGGLPLHDYANTYLTARNPMLYKRLCEGLLDELCVLSISPRILDMDGAVMSDRNAAASYCRFAVPADALPVIDGDLVKQTYWTTGSPLEQERCRNAKFTEVLIPHEIPPALVFGVQVGSSSAESALSADGCPLDIVVNKELFFEWS